MSTEAVDRPRMPICRHCRHYHVTWDSRAPHGCRVLGFKTKRPPALVVYESSGIPCQHFRERPAEGRRRG